MPLRIFSALLASLAFLAAPVFAQQTLELYYQFDGDATNALGNAALDGTASNASISYATGVFGQAVVTNNGTDSFIDSSVDATNINFGGNAPKTTSAWVRTSSFGNHGVWGMGNGSNGQMWSLRDRGSTDTWRAQHWGGSFDYDFDTPGFSGNWAHVVMVHDGTEGRTYYNGQLVGSRTMNLNVQGNDLEIGRYNQGNDDIWTGEIDDVAFWSTETLTDAEVNALYHLGLPSSFDNLSSPNGFNLNAGEVDELLALHDGQDPNASIEFEAGYAWTYAEDLTALAGSTPLGEPFQVGGTTYLQLSTDGTGTGLALAAIPEPATMALWLLLGLGVCLCRYFRIGK